MGVKLTGHNFESAKAARRAGERVLKDLLQLANKGLDTQTLQAYLGHRSINSTTRYAALAPGRFKNIWGRV